MDARQYASRTGFLKVVAAEFEAAAEAGLRVAVLHAGSLSGPSATGRFIAELQDLADAGVIHPVTSEDSITAGVTVIRHAGVLQGHRMQRLPIVTSRVVVVDEPSAGDSRGLNFSRSDVTNTASTWFGVEPSWVDSLPALPAAIVTMFAASDEGVRLHLNTAVPRLVHGVRLVSETAEIALSSTITGADALVASADAAEISTGDWHVMVDYNVGDDSIVSERVAIAADAMNQITLGVLAVRVGADVVRLLAAEPGGDLPGQSEVVAQYVTARVTSVRISRGNAELTIGGGAALRAVYGLREVGDGVVRTRDFAKSDNTTGERVWRRSLTKFADSRWLLCGVFSTPFGDVRYPIPFDEATVFEGDEAWHPRATPAGMLLVAPPVPGRLKTALLRGAGMIDKTRGRLSAGGQRSETSPGAGNDLNRFDARHAAVRASDQPMVSVVMPVYNVEPYLDAAITAALGQARTDIELIIVDDASSDNGQRIIMKHWAADPRVRVFGLDHNTLGGAGIPSNIGIRAARGKYVAFADSDDVMTNAGLAALVEAAERNQAQLAIGDFRTFTDKVKEGAEAYDRAVWAKLPLGTPISAATEPDLFRLSPVPWRKLYRRDFLEANDIRYPEGDYFYEDNPLHWFVLSRATRVVLVDEVISWHRMEREGQTMSAQTYRLGAFANHMNSIFTFLDADESDGRDSYFESFFDYLDRTNWVIRNQTQRAAGDLLRRGFGEVFQRARASAPKATVPPKAMPRLSSYATAYADVDLTVVIPVFDSADLIGATIDSVLGISGITFNVLLVDDGSTDGSLEILQQYETRHANVHVFTQGNRGAGRARNAVIPLSTGRYTYFLDADDVIDPRALVEAVFAADREDADLMLMKYRIDHIDEKKTRGMYKADEEIWGRLRQSAHQAERQQLAAKLINYPWNRIIRTTLLHDANIFFGATVVHNDVLFHWHSIVAAQRISYVEVEVCSHRKFATRAQVTNINDARRLAVLEALRSTHARIRDLPDYDNVRWEWMAFAKHLLDWATTRIPETHRDVYAERSAELEAAFRADSRSGEPIRR